MGIKIDELIAKIEQIAPPQLAETWDNQGLMISPVKKEISSILLALELTPEVIKEAKKLSTDMIITHHPLFFVPIKTLDIGNSTAAYAIKLLAGESIGLYSAHTSFDAALGGLNDELIDRLGIENVPPADALSRVRMPNYSRLGRFRDASVVSLSDVLDQVKKGLGIEEELRYRGKLEKKVKRVMTCSGGGGDVIEMAKELGADVFITGDIRQHEWRLAEALDLPLIDAGHYWTERIFAEAFKKRLGDIEGVQISVSKKIRPPYATR
ncbi:MAG: Nif3-like dinuclear metal center hexameric protein [Clostridiales Family XIII bacterium]|nr:Nif3-like dinuclear metal center hexameric protein [Clostridiales Family XIII bacterium]